MPLHAPTLVPSLESLTATDTVVIGVSKTAEGPLVLGDGFSPAVYEALTQALAHIEADGAKDYTWRVPAPHGMTAASVVFSGLGEAGSSAEALRAAAGYAAQSVNSPTRLVFALPHSD